MRGVPLFPQHASAVSQTWQPQSWSRKLKLMVSLLSGLMHLLPCIRACSRKHLLPAAAPLEGGEAAVVLPLAEVHLGGTPCSQKP